ncbi:Yip1 family protein [Streptomyces palmae]|uniref:YIP1 family protein n=1 Tax=Streptomyces palmae TaxID=1701085 RepID=A0A4Z0H8V8_9ACTN|nr:YIP1 family protein [Streptomyces palmae]
MGRGQDPGAGRGPQGQPGHHPGQQAGQPPYGQAPYGRPQTPPAPYGQQAPPPYGRPTQHGGPGGQPQPNRYGRPGPQPGPQPAPQGHPGAGGYRQPNVQWPQASPHGSPHGSPHASSHGEPEYFDGAQPPHGRPGPTGGHPGYPSGDSGSTQQFSLGEAPDYDSYGGEPGSYGDDQVGAYRAGQPAPPAGPRLPWKQLLSGIVLRPSATFWQMRDHTMWGAALTVTFVYGLLAVFGLDQAREDVLNASLSNSIPWIICTAVAVVASGLVLGAVTHTLARQLGGDGLWAPTIGLSLLIMSISDAPRLVVAMFLGGDNGLVTVLGWATWLGAGALFTSMVGKSHDLPWPRALAASALQLAALLFLLKLGNF